METPAQELNSFASFSVLFIPQFLFICSMPSRCGTIQPRKSRESVSHAAFQREGGSNRLQGWPRRNQFDRDWDYSLSPWRARLHSQRALRDAEV
jgi:hypothetical protein